VSNFDDPEFLKLRSEGADFKAVMARFGVSRYRVFDWIDKATKAGLTTMREVRHWSETDLQTLHNLNTDKKSTKQIAAALNRSERSIVAKMDSLGIRTVERQASFWTDEKREAVRKGYAAGTPVVDIAKSINTTTGAVAGMAARMKLTKVRASYPSNRSSAARTVYRTDHLRTPEAIAKAQATKRANAGLKPVPQRRAKVVEPQVIPETARPWLTRKHGECAYPYGERHNIHSCCAPTFAESSYCESHAGLCFDYSRKKAA
jgi:hypothetical protein